MYDGVYSKLNKHLNASLPSFPKGTPHPIFPIRELFSPLGVGGNWMLKAKTNFILWLA
jgi:hypothetical protein